MEIASWAAHQETYTRFVPDSHAGLQAEASMRARQARRARRQLGQLHVLASPTMIGLERECTGTHLLRTSEARTDTGTPVGQSPLLRGVRGLRLHRPQL